MVPAYIWRKTAKLLHYIVFDRSKYQTTILVKNIFLETLKVKMANGFCATNWTFFCKNLTPLLPGPLAHSSFLV